MNFKLILLFTLVLILAMGCQGSLPESSTPISPTSTSYAPTDYPTLIFTPSPTRTPLRLIHQPELISKDKLDCSSLGTYTKCIDDVLNVEFEYPTAWGDIEAVLRTGGYSGYAYDYLFGGKTIAETEPLVAGGRSIDFSEGGGGMSTDFAGYGDSGLQFKKEACDPEWQDLFPICHVVSTNVTWMIRFPNARYICDSAPGFYTTPVFRIEVNLPDNPRINGFVFEAPFLSALAWDQVESHLYPLLGLGADMVPTKCRDADQQAFDHQRMAFIQRISAKTVDSETQRNLDQLIHLATSIRFR